MRLPTALLLTLAAASGCGTDANASGALVQPVPEAAVHVESAQVSIETAAIEAKAQPAPVQPTHIAEVEAQPAPESIPELQVAPVHTPAPRPVIEAAPEWDCPGCGMG